MNVFPFFFKQTLQLWNISGFRFYLVSSSLRNLCRTPSFVIVGFVPRGRKASFAVTDAPGNEARPLQSAAPPPPPHLCVLTTSTSAEQICQSVYCNYAKLRFSSGSDVSSPAPSDGFSFQGSGVVCADGSRLGWNDHIQTNSSLSHTHTHGGPFRDSLLAFFFQCQKRKNNFRGTLTLCPAVNDGELFNFTNSISKVG